MLKSEIKKQENIAEYIIYMWQLEDLLRAFQFDMGLVRSNLIFPQSKDEATQNAVEEWYEEFIHKMEIQGIKESGHLNELNDVMIEMLYLHNTLLNITKDKDYIKCFDEAVNLLKEFDSKSNNSSLNPVESCLRALYGKLLLKIQGKSISPETEEAFQKFTKVLAVLSLKYKEMKSGAMTN